MLLRNNITVQLRTAVSCIITAIVFAKLSLADPSPSPSSLSSTVDFDGDTIRAYPCNEDYSEIQQPYLQSQGCFARLCLQAPTEFMLHTNSIKEVTVTQAQNEPYQYIDNFIPSSLANTTCTLSDIGSFCKIQIQLLSEYFDTPNPADLDVSGVVLRERRLSVEVPLKVHDQDINDTAYSASNNKSTSQIKRHLDDLSPLYNFNMTIGLLSQVEVTSGGRIQPSNSFATIIVMGLSFYFLFW